MSRKSIWAGLLLVLILAAAGAFADVPGLINYQAYLTDPDGVPISDVLDMEFTLWDDAVSTDPLNLLWTETWDIATSQVSVIDGYYSVMLGTYYPGFGTIFEDESDVWLQVSAWNGSAYEDLTPRKHVVSVAYALVADKANGLTALITEDMLADNAVTEAKIAANAITVNKIAVGAITEDKLAADAVTGDKIAAGAVSSSHIASGAIGSDQIDDGAIQGADIAGDALGQTEIADIYVLNTGDNVAGDLTIMGGMVGIGTVSPTERLDVSGNAYVSGNLTVDGSISGYSEYDPQVGTNLTNYVPKWNGSALSSGSIYDNGNVGIGTNLPGAKLDVSVPAGGPAANIGSGANATGDYDVAMGYHTNALGSSSTAMGHYTTASAYASTAMGHRTTASGSYSTATGAYTTASGSYSTAMGYFIVAEGPGSFGIGLDSTARTITQANTMAVMGGNVGIGTVSPGSHRLSVKNNIGEQHGSSLWAENTNSGGIAIWAKNSNSTDTTLVVENLGTGHIVKGFGLGGEKFRVENDGDVVIAGNGYKPGGGSWADSSDIRLKQNVETMDGALDSMLALRGVTFEWREPEKHGNLTGTQMGMIAQEVEEVFPGWVSEGDDGFKILGIRGFEALTVEAVRELKHENEQLRAENEKLKRTVDAIQSEVERLAALVDGASGVTAWEAEQ